MHKLFVTTALSLGLASAAIFPAGAQDAVPIRFTLDWTYQGIHAFVFWAEEKGYFDAEGLDVTIDQGQGSAATVTRIVSGAYDAGLGDVNAIIQLAGTEGGTPPVMVYMLYNNAPFALISKAGSGIESLSDVAGRKLGTPASAAAGRLFPLLAEKNGIDASSVEIVNMAPNLQEQMLLTDQVDVSAVFTVTSYANLVGQNVDPETDIDWFFYADHGLELYSNGLMVSRALAEDNPDAVTGLTRALNRAMIEVAADPDAAIALLTDREPLLNGDLEKRRLLYALDNHILTAETDEIGIGAVKDERMGRAIEMIAESYDLPRTPAVEEIFDHSFLPPAAERVLPSGN